MKQYLSYWTVEQVQAGLAIGELPHAASEQYDRLTPGNRVWICGRVEDTPEIFVIGYIDVWYLVEQFTAQQLLNKYYNGYYAWSATWHILPRLPYACPTRAVSLEPLYTRLTFESRTSQRLLLERGHPNAQQLQAMRRLTPNGAAALNELWQAHSG